MINVFIVGSAGTTGLRLKERLELRKDVELLSISDKLRKDPDAIRSVLKKSDFAFLCLPDDAAKETAKLAESLPVRLLDTSTAHRTSPDWAYGFPELSQKHISEIKASKQVAVPGCHASGFISLVYPLIAAGALPKDCALSCTSLTGYSGGGKKMIAEYEAQERSSEYSSTKLYAMQQMHKHIPEMTAQCSLSISPVFLPIVGDYFAGMLVCVPLQRSQLTEGITLDELRNIYAKHYAGSKLVKVVEEPTSSLYANPLAGRDDMEISVSGNGEQILLCSRFDNLGKGASGAAIECLNIMCGLSAETGLNVG